MTLENLWHVCNNETDLKIELSSGEVMFLKSKMLFSLSEVFRNFEIQEIEVDEDAELRVTLREMM